MIKQLLLPLLGVAAFIILVGLLFNNPRALNFSVNPTPQASLTKSTISVGDKKIQVELAQTKSERELGLGNRSYLAPDSGMLFIFDSKNVIPNFWMKGMLMPIDIVWIGDSKIVKIDKHVPVQAAGTSDSELPIYSPGQPIDYVLEVNSGFSDRNDIQIGDSVDLGSEIR